MRMYRRKYGITFGKTITLMYITAGISAGITEKCRGWKWDSAEPEK